MLVCEILFRTGFSRKKSLPTSGSGYMARVTIRLVRRAFYHQMQIDGGTMHAYIPAHCDIHARV